MSYAGKRVLAFESRRAVETAELIRRNGGEPIVAPALREAPLERNEEALRFGESLLHAAFDTVILLTGVGTRQLMKVLATRFSTGAIADALQRTTLVARGPKPTAALREIGLAPAIIAPEPNTWREVLRSMEGREGRRIAIQEYGRPATELAEALRTTGAEVTSVPVYSYELPEDLAPLRDAVQRLQSQTVDVTLFTTGTQLIHLMQVSSEMGLADEVLEGLRRTFIASIGPTTTETLGDYHLAADLEPSHPKLGLLVKESAERAEDILCQKRS